MSDKTYIEWTEATWNVVSGCTRVSDGCTNCYIERTPPFRVAHRRFDRDGTGGTTGVQLHPERLTIPHRWRKPRRIFVCSLADLFHYDVPDDFIAQVWAAMAVAERHTFQVLTKRHARMRSLLSSEDFRSEVAHNVLALTVPDGDELPSQMTDLVDWWPLRNVWLGVTAENQQWADIRIPALLDTPAAVRFVSAEPLLGWIDLRQIDYYEPDHTNCSGLVSPAHEPACGCEPGKHWGINWVIAGGESGPGARPMHPNWARGLRDQCQESGTAFLFKQRGEWTWNEPDEFRMPTEPYTDRVAVMHGAGMTAMTKGNPFNPFERGHPHWATRIERVGKKRAGRELDGREWNEYPQAVTV